MNQGINTEMLQHAACTRARSTARGLARSCQAVARQAGARRACCTAHTVQKRYGRVLKFSAIFTLNLPVASFVVLPVTLAPASLAIMIVAKRSATDRYQRDRVVSYAPSTRAPSRPSLQPSPGRPGPQPGSPGAYMGSRRAQRAAPRTPSPRPSHPPSQRWPGFTRPPVRLSPGPGP